VQDIVARFEKYLLHEKRYSLHTASSYLRDTRQFLFFLEQRSNLNLGEITQKHIRLWIRELVANSIKPRSINRKLSSLRSFFKFSVRIGCLQSSPATAIPPLKTEKTIPSFIEEDAGNILDQIDYGNGFSAIRDKTIIFLFYTTGIRLSELTGLNTSDINIHKRQAKVLGKRSKERIVPLLGETTDLLTRYMNARNLIETTNSKLFVTDKGEEIYPKLVYRIVNKYLTLATTVSKRSPHVLRHSFATHMLNNGADLNAIKELLGHANLAATEVYTHNSFEKLKNTYKKSHPRE